MATVDSLDIQISAQANKASASLDGLVKKLDRVSASLSGVNSRGLTTLGAGVNKLSNAVSNFSKNTKSSDFTRIAKGFERFSKIDSAGLLKTSSGLNTLAKSMSSLSKIENLGNLTSAINAIKNLARVDMSGFDTSKMQTIANSINDFASKISSVGEIDSKVVRLVGSMAKLSNSGQYIKNVSDYFPSLGNQVVKLVKDLSKTRTIDANITKLVDGISRIASAGKKAEETSANMQKLGDSIMDLLNRLKNAPAINANIANTIQGLGNLAASGSRMSTISNKVSNSGTKLGNVFKNLKEKISGANKSSKGFVSSIGLFYAKAFLIIRAVKKLGSAIESSMDYIETLNYFNAAFGQVADVAVSQWEEAGYNSAESYYNSFSERAKQLTEKMTGFTIAESGMLETTGGKSLGIDPENLMNYQSIFAQMSSSMGVASETALKLSNVLTEIGADLASVKNMDFDAVWTDMASGLAGMSRTLDKYGVNIRNVNLQQKLTELGIDANITALNQNDKALLRTIILLDSTRYAWGDLSKTINQPANQLRLIEANFNNLARTIGNIFLPIVAKVLPYINMFVQALQRLAEWIVKLLGFEDFDWGGASGIGGMDLSDLIEDTEDEAGALNDAGKAAKKLKNQLQGFDELNVITTQNDSENGNAAGGVTDVSGALEGGLDKILEEYQKAWDKAFSEMEERANKFADNIGEAFKTGGLYAVGQYFSEELTKSLNSIPWDSVYEGAKSFGTGLANFLNGLISPGLFGAVGTTIASSLNTALYALNSFGTTFDWKNFGESIATGINDFFSTFDFKNAADTINVWIKGALTTASTLLKKTDFEKIGNKIGEFLKELDFLEIAGDLAETIWEAIKSTFELLKGIFEEAPLESSLIAAFGVLTFTGLGSFVSGKISTAITERLLPVIGTNLSTVIGKLGTTISTTLGTKVIPAFTKFFTTTLPSALSSIGSSIGTFFTTFGATIVKVLGSIGAIIAAAIAGWHIGQWIYEVFTGEEIDMTFKEQMSEIASAFSDGTIKDAIKLMWEDISNWWDENVINTVVVWIDGIVNTFKKISTPAITVFKNIWSKIQIIFKDPKSYFEGKFTDAYKTIQKVFSSIGTWANEKWKSITDVFDKVNGYFTTIFRNAYTNITTAFLGIGTWAINKWKSITNVFDKAGTYFSEKFTDAYLKVTGAFSGIGTWASDTWKKVTDVFDGEKIKKWFKNAFEKGYKGITEVFSKIDNFFKGIASNIASPIKKALEAIKKGLNWILGKVGATQISGEIDMPTAFAKGTSSLPKDTVGVVNDQKGATYRELILPPDGKPFIPKGRNVMLPLKKGTKIMPAAQTKEFVSKMKNMPHFAGGVGDFFSGLFGNIKSFTGDILDYLEKPKDILKIAFSKFVNPSGWVGVIKDIAGGALKTITNSATDYIKKIFDEGINVKYDPTKGVLQWKGLASKALKLTKQYSDSNLSYLLNQMQHESGGNPNAINNWDINAKLGHPSKGLMQVIDSTFKSYALSPYNKNIYDPLSNVIASIRYTVSRYGSLYAGWAARGYKGYAAGGFPEDGWFRASKNELIGQWDNGQSAVVTNYQIAEGISDAVQKGNQENNMLMRQEISVLQRQNEILMGILEKETGITYKDAFEAVRRGDAEYKMINGQSAFLY